jgi:acetylornithine deacetylase/succinyl-diaminopimelate desuccinylase-like protein
VTPVVSDQLVIAPMVLSNRQQDYLATAEAQVDPAQLRALVAALVDIPSPTGEEATLSRYITGVLNHAGVDARFQPIDNTQANAVGRVGGTGGGPSLLLYAPIDTVTTGNADEDCPGVGETLRSDMVARAEDRGQWVVGLGASNPKGHAACVIMAARAISQAGIALRGDLLVGLGAGGMPTNKRPGSDRYNAGQGNGCAFMLEQGVHPDFAVIAKPGWAVAWEEVGLCWFRVRVHGLFNYVGSRQRIKYVNPIVDVATVILALEEWASEYATRNTSGLVAPQAQIGAIEGGWSRMPSFTPAACDLWLDVRISPRTPPADVSRQFADAIGTIKQRNPDLELSWEMVLSIPGSSTSPDNWIVQSTARAWEAVAGRSHEAITNTSGATDANILRGCGVPTARVGMPKVADDLGTEVDFSLGMNAVDVNEMVRLTRLLIRTAIETCDQSVADVVALERAL